LLLLALPSLTTLPLSVIRLFHRRVRKPINRAHEVVDTAGRALAKAAAASIYLQREALIAFDAVLTSLSRLARGRQKMLEWHPARRGSLFVRLRVYEVAIMLLLFAERGLGPMTCLAGWFVIGPSMLNWVTITHVEPIAASEIGNPKFSQELEAA
jgi:hypothetical protein